MSYFIEKRPIHLGLGASAYVEPEFTGDMSWYEAYGARHAADGAEGRLVSLHRFTENWDMWEMHPKGSEVVLCLSGAMTLHQEGPSGSVEQTVLEAGHYAINSPGVWHTADVTGEASALFMTAGEGTEHRPR